MTAQLATISKPQNAPALTGARQIGLTPQSIDEALRMAEIMSKASIVPKDYQGNPGNILVAIQWGAEIGLPPLQAMQNLAVINGRPALWGDAVIALVRGSGLLESIQEEIFSDVCTCTVKRRGEPPATRSFSVEDAKRAGLYGKQGPWQQYPKRMLQMRARAWALRDVFPDVLRGVHVAEEAQDMPNERPMGQAEVISTEPPTSRTEAVKAALAGRGKAKAATMTPTPVAATDAPQEGPDLPMVLTLIRDAGTEMELHGAGEMAGRLTSTADKDAARAAYKARKEAMRQEAEEEARLEREAIQAEAEATDSIGSAI
jgi:hypothetical protein